MLFKSAFDFHNVLMYDHCHTSERVPKVWTAQCTQRRCHLLHRCPHRGWFVLDFLLTHPWGISVRTWTKHFNWILIMTILLLGWLPQFRRCSISLWIHRNLFSTFCFGIPTPSSHWSVVAFVLLCTSRGIVGLCHTSIVLLSQRPISRW